MSNNKQKDWKTVREDLGEHDGHDIVTEHDEASDDEALAGISGALDHPSYPEMEEKLTLAEQQSHENWEKAVRAMAELDNVRRRAERDVAHAHKYALEKFASALLPVMDSLEQAAQLAAKAGDVPMQEGLSLTMQLFLEVLTKHGVEQLDPIGAVFDPQYHEAMTAQPADDVPENTVLTVFQKGYMLNERVVRPARVIVSKKNA